MPSIKCCILKLFLEGVATDERRRRRAFPEKSPCLLGHLLCLQMLYILYFPEDRLFHQKSCCLNNTFTFQWEHIRQEWHHRSHSHHHSYWQNWNYNQIFIWISWSTFARVPFPCQSYPFLSGGALTLFEGVLFVAVIFCLPFF